MTIASELTGLQQDITNARNTIVAKGGTVTVGGGSSQLATDINSIFTTNNFIRRPIVGGELKPIDTFETFVGVEKIGTYALTGAYMNSSITTANFGSVEEIGGLSACFETFKNAYFLTSATFPNLKVITEDALGGCNSMFTDCIRLTNVSFPVLHTIERFASQCFYNAFKGCESLTNVSFPALRTVLGTGCFTSAFEGCTSLQSVSFPALYDVGGSTDSNFFTWMLVDCENVTVHFPSNMQAVIGSWSDVLDGFHGTNTTVLFDLPPSS